MSLHEKMRELVADMPYEENIEDILVEADDYEEDPRQLMGFIPDFHFVPTDWLMRFFESPQAASVIETSDYLCIHGKLDLDKINEVKVVNTHVVERMYLEAGEGVGRRLSKRSLCRYCVRDKCKQIKLSRNLNNDAKIIAELLKEKLPE